MICEHCGIGQRDFRGPCDWCGAPARPELPLLIAGRRSLGRSTWAAWLRRRGAVVTGVTAGILVHLLAAAVGVIYGVPLLWQSGFLWSQQWWWALAPEAGQPWLFAAARGAAYGALAGLVTAAGTGRRGDGKTGGRGDGETGGRGERAGRISPSPRLPVSPSPRLSLPPSPATVTALVAFVVSGWDGEGGTQYCIVSALLGAAVGRLTTLIMSGKDPRLKMTGGGTG
jgi:hypothetical protein